MCNANQVTVVKEEHKIVADISDFGDFETLPSGRPGLTLGSKAGKKDTVWAMTEIHRRDGEVTHWCLMPTEATLEVFPALIGWQFIVFND